MGDLTEQPSGATLLNDISGLLQTHISTHEQLNAAEQLNIQQATDWLSRTRSIHSIFTAGWLKELHKHMFVDVWKWAGNFRKTATNIGASPHEIPMRLAAAAADFNTWFNGDSQKLDLLLFAANYHHRLALIHPFLNGNGRWSRLAVDAVYLRLLGRSPLIWSGSSLHDAGEQRSRYIAALVEADGGNIQPLVDYLRVLNPDH